MNTDATAIGFLISDPSSPRSIYRAAMPATGLRELGATVVVSDEFQQVPSGELALAMQSGLGLPRYSWQPDALVIVADGFAFLPPIVVREARAEGQRVYLDVAGIDRELDARERAICEAVDGVIVNTASEHFRYGKHARATLIRTVLDPMITAPAYAALFGVDTKEIAARLHAGGDQREPDANRISKTNPSESRTPDE